MADAVTSASVVAVDSKSVAAARDKAARDALAGSLEQPRQLQIFSGVNQTIPFSLKVVADVADRDRIQSILDQAFALCEKVLSEFNPQSELSTINRSDVGKTITMSKPLEEVINAGIRIMRSSGGGFNPCFGPLSDFLCEYALKNNGKTAPFQNDDPEAISQFENGLKVAIACSNMETAFSVKGNQITRLLSDSNIRLTSLSKGYTVDNVINGLHLAGFKNAIFEWGGDIRATGKSHRGELWKVGIRCPPTLGEISEGLSEEASRAHSGAPNSKVRLIRLCELDNEAIATSGDYEHLLIPKKHVTRLVDVKRHQLIVASQNHMAQVSVKNASCMYADGLATATLLKREFRNGRWFLENWRFNRHYVSDFTFFIRDNETVAKMHELARETNEMREARIAQGIPARVVVVGGGLAGLCAAIEAARCNSSVVLLEKTSKLGGNSAKATSGINGWGTRPQAARDIQDDAKFFERDTFLSGKGGNTNHGLVKMLSAKAGDSIHWLTKETNLPLTVLSQLGGHSRPRTHRIPDSKDGEPVPVGFTIMKRLIEKINSPELKCRIVVLTETTCVGLTSVAKQRPSGSVQPKVIGVRYQKTGAPADARAEELRADAVVLATGGFGNDHTANSLLKEFAPELVSVPTTNGDFSTGDGVKLARSLGAALEDMDKVQLHPTGFINPSDPANKTKYLGPEALRGSGGILLAPTTGRRFVNELDLRSVVSKAILDLGHEYPKSNGSRFAYCVLNEPAMKLFGKNQLSFYRERVKVFQDAPDVKALAAIVGAPEDAVRETLSAYAAAAKKGFCPQTNKNVFPVSVGPEGPFIVAAISPSIHYTMGGLAISPSAEVQMQPDHKVALPVERPICCLFAAGEVSSGVHGANRLGGNSLLECVVFGRIAGDRAGTVTQRRTRALSFDDWTNVTVREVREGGDFGRGARILMLNLPGALQVTGLLIGQFVAIRGEWDGRTLNGYYSPITLPYESGVIGILARADKGALREWVSALKPGDAVQIKGAGGLQIHRSPPQKCFLFEGTPIRKIGMIAGGTGVAPMLQIIRAAIREPYCSMDGLKLIYASETEEEITYEKILQEFEATSNGKFDCHFVINHPPPGWTSGVGFVDNAVLKSQMFPPSDDLLVVICGPPVMQNVVKRSLVAMGHAERRVRTVDDAPSASSKL